MNIIGLVLGFFLVLLFIWSLLDMAVQKFLRFLIRRAQRR